MRVLLVSYAYAPVLSPRAFRWTAIARHWAGQGHQVDVVCASVGGQQDQEVLDGVHVHRVAWTLLGPVRSAFKGHAGPISHPGLRARIRRGLVKCWELLCWPDYACLWFPAAANRARALINNHPYDLVISASLPFTGHLVAWYARKAAYGLPWIVDCGDPFSFRAGDATFNAWLYAPLNRLVESRLFSAATAVAVTTEGTARRYRELFPAVAGHIHVIPPLLSMPEAVDTARCMSPCGENQGGDVADSTIRLVFVGTLYKGLRRPDPLLAAFVQLLASTPGQGLELHFYGNVDACMDSLQRHRELLGRSIHIHGLVPREQAQAAMAAASVLVNIGNGSHYQLPSKVVEYLALNKPVLNFVAIENDSSAAFFAGFDGVLNVVGNEATTDPARFADLLRFVTEPQQVDTQLRSEHLRNFGVDHIAASYVALREREAPR